MLRFCSRRSSSRRACVAPRAACRELSYNLPEEQQLHSLGPACLNYSLYYDLPEDSEAYELGPVCPQNGLLLNTGLLWNCVTFYVGPLGLPGTNLPAMKWLLQGSLMKAFGRLLRGCGSSSTLEYRSTDWKPPLQLRCVGGSLGLGGYGRCLEQGQQVRTVRCSKSRH